VFLGDPSLLRFQNEILRMIANGEPLFDTMRQLCLRVEKTWPGVLCSVFAIDRTGVMRPLAAPSFPEAYSQAHDGVAIGPDTDAPGRAASSRKPVLLEDLASDPRASHSAAIIHGLGVSACWSLPVLGAAGDTLAVMNLYFHGARQVADVEREVAEACVELCETAFRRHESTLDRDRRANVDALTGLANRAAYNGAMAQLRCDDVGSWALFIIDLDNLKIVNDTFGHLAGDALIRAASARIARAMAPDVTYRIGGDEFAVILQQPANVADLNAAAERVFDELEVAADCDGHTVVPRATIGGATLSKTERTATSVGEAADFALYHAKETGRGGFVRYWPGIGSRITSRRAAIRDVSEALAENRIEAHYQPILRLDTGLIVGLEALCRLRSRSGDLLPAGSFQEATTDAHVASELTARMMAIVAADIGHWQNAGLLVEQVSLNVSTADFYTGSLAKKVSETFSKAGIGLNKIVLEISEDVYLGRNDRVVAREIEVLRAAGVRVALDDFGTGYASLTHLVNVPVDIIKIDRAFVARLWPDDPSTIIVEGLIEIARRLGVAVVAVGIETEVQASQLWAMGCGLGQGYAFAYPADRDATGTLLYRHAASGAGTSPLYADRPLSRPNGRVSKRRTSVA